MTAADWPEVAAIYADGIATGDATFETEVPEWEDWDRARRGDCRIVAERGGAGAPETRRATGSPGAVVGFACLSPVSKRPAYAGVAEAMVYVSASCRGRGIGGRLLRALAREADASGVWTLQAHVFPENGTSVRAHQRAGFRVAGVRERIGRSADGRWRDTLLLERRSRVAGVD